MMCGARVLFRSGDRSRRRIGSARLGWPARRGRCPHAPFGMFAQGTRHHVAGGGHDLARGSGRLDGLRLRDPVHVPGSHQVRGAISSCIFCGPYEPGWYR